MSHSTQPEAYELFVVIKMKHGFALWESVCEIQEEIKEMVEKMTAFNVSAIDIEVRGID